MDRGDQNRYVDETREEAETWFLRIRDGFSQADFRQWRQWLAEDDTHAAAFDAVREFWQETDLLTELPWPSEDELTADIYDGQTPLPVASPHPVRHQRNSGLFWMAAAASLVVACLIGFGLLHDNIEDPAGYETATAEHRLIQLADGSSVTLGAESDVRIAYSRSARRIELRSGEAYFKVAKDASRPFIVAAGARTVRALGTEFDVNIGVRDIKVSVIEGQVRVEGPALQDSEATGQSGSATILDLGSGDVLDFNAAGGLEIVSEADPMLSTSWLNGRLAYDGARLESVIADVNRYSETEIIIGDEATKQLIFTGTIFSNDIDNWLAGIEHVFPLRQIKVDEHGILIIHADR